MTDKTYAEMKDIVAQKLGILAAGDSLSAEDGDVIGSTLLQVQAQLDRLGLVSFDVESGMDEAYADPVAEIAASMLVDTFMVPEPMRSEMRFRGMLGAPGRSPAERRLRYLLDGLTTKLATGVVLYESV